MDTDDETSKVTAKSAGDEYETQLLGFTPPSFSNGIFNAFNQYMSDGLGAMKEMILKEYSDVITEKEVHKEMRDIQESIENEFDNIFDHFECYTFNNVLKIPAHVVLPEDKIQEEELVREKLEDEILDLQEQVQAIQFANCSLGEELELADKTQAELDKLLNHLEESDALFSDDLKENASTCLDEIEKLAHVIKTT
ncbi:hypothetical protein LOTGIDRAFT_235437 [Lottia gigantea]|uniref:Protein MIS12 homolog n=1 Tax=Lottia gigantea TaxID=225164 RepID=V3Z6I8_LOTGI|nr:hypothetical protein LOTGIDRAFT_235437 [Lottia gigantea]ESO86378.1 hypothetical protein LOTGIDRAFT_235437 [Lottia gigantea]